MALLGAVICWSSVPLFLKHFAASLDAWTVNGVRYGLAALVMLPAVLARPHASTPGRNIWLDALVPAAVNTLGQIGWSLSPYYIDAGLMGFGIRSCFFFALIGGMWLLPEERYLARSRLFWLGSIVCVWGILGLFWGSLRQAGASPLGLAILLATAMVWGFYGVTVRKFMRGYSPQRGFGVICLYTAAVLVLLLLFLGRFRALPSVGLREHALLAASAVVGIVAAHVMMYFVIARLGPVIESGGEFAMPFLTFCGAALLFGERLTWLQWLGGAGVVLGGVLLVLSHRPAAPDGARRSLSRRTGSRNDATTKQTPAATNTARSPSVEATTPPSRGAQTHPSARTVETHPKMKP